MKRIFPKVAERALKKRKIGICLLCNFLYIGKKKCKDVSDLKDWLASILLIDKNLIGNEISYDHIRKKVIFSVCNLQIGVGVREFICNDCRRRLSKKCNLKIQVRGSSTFLEKSCEIVEKILKRSKANIIEVKEVRNGVDFLVNTNNRAVKSIDSSLSKYFVMKKTYKIDTIDRRTSKLKKVATILIKNFKDGVKV